MKRAKKLETPWEMAQHALPVILGFWLLFENQWKVLDVKFPPQTPGVLWAGLTLTALGVGTSIWARLSLGANWSGVVTLKKEHELVRKGLYRWIRHPIYAGILTGVIGTAMINGHVRGWLGLCGSLFTSKPDAKKGFCGRNSARDLKNTREIRECFCQ